MKKIQSEKQIQDSILKYLKKTYPTAVVWKIHEDPVYGVTGIPDIFFAYKGKVAFFEVKRPGGVISPRQKVILKQLQLKNAITAEVVYSVEDVKRTLTDLEYLW